MSAQDRQRWDARYSAGEYAGRTHPTVLLEQWLPALSTGRALDVACGAGRNAVFLANQGYQVDAVDVSAVGLERAAQTAAAENAQVNWINLDLQNDELPAGPYDLIVVSRFLLHTLVPQILDRVATGGAIVYEQHVRSNETDIGGPRSNRFRLREQELLRLFGELHVDSYYEGLVVDPGGARMALAQLVAHRR